MALGKLGKYERVDVLGYGATGIVYLAWDTLLRKRVALKEIDVQAADISRFLEEARVMDRLQHPNIVRVNSVELLEGRVLIDMEYVRGRNLQALLREEGRLPANRALGIAIQTLDALDYAHRMRTVHRDIKPANILIGPDDCVKLVDFGLAEILATNSYAGGAGTYAYMAPEDFAEEQHSDHRTDIWAVGVTLFEMLTGARAFTVSKPRDPFVWRKTLMTEEPARLEDYLDRVPDGLQQALDRALAREKTDRWQSAAEFRDALIAIRDGSELHPLYTGRPRSPEQRPLAPVGGLQTLTARPETMPARRRFPLLRQREPLPARVEVEPPGIDLGELRHGDSAAGRVTFRILDGEGRPEAEVTDAPPWLTVSPTRFSRRRQVLTISAHTGRINSPGEYQDAVTLRTSAGAARIPVAIRVLPARRRFSEVAIWLIPLFAAVLLPAVTVAMLARTTDARFLVPAAALASGLLSAMLLMVCAEADTGVEERLAAGVVMAVMAAVLGVVLGVANRTGFDGAVYPMIGAGVPIGATLLFQSLARRFWKVWALVIVTLSVLSAFSFINAVTG